MIKTLLWKELDMKNLFIPQFILLLLVLNGQVSGMCHVTKLIAYKNPHRAYFFSHNINNTKMTENKINDSQKTINNKDNENKQRTYIVNINNKNHGEDKMAFYKKWQ